MSGKEGPEGRERHKQVSGQAKTLPVVWLFGAPGVGKSTAGYGVMSKLADAGVQAAFVDADQLRLASGVAASETELIASALPALAEGYRAHGAQVMIASGLVHDRDHLAALLSGFPDGHALAIYLTASPETIRERVRQRGWMVQLADEAANYAARIDPTFADLYFDNTHKAPELLAADITMAIATHLDNTSSKVEKRAAETPLVTPTRIIMVTGPGGAGVSTAGFQVFSRLAQAGESTGYLDANQLGFLGNKNFGYRLAQVRATNARAVMSSLARGGAKVIVVSGEPRAIDFLARAWDASKTEAFWLHASPAALGERIEMRSRGGGPPIPGDHRIGLAGLDLAESIAVAVGESRSMSVRPDGATMIDTSSMIPSQVADAILAAAEPKFS